MFDPQRMLGQMLGGALGGAFGGSRKRSRGLLGTSSAMKAQVGIGLLGVAFAAYEHFQQQRGGFAAGAGSHPHTPPTGMTMPPPPPAGGAMPPPPPGVQRAMPPPPPSAVAGGSSASTRVPVGAEAPPATGTGSDAVLIMQAMIAAAAADGRIDDDERKRIVERATAAGADAEGMQFLEGELVAPKSLEIVARSTRREIAADVYAASVLAISLDTAQEREYLDRLARALALEEPQRADIHARLGVAGYA